MSSIDVLLDELFDALTTAEGNPTIDPRMALKPDLAARSYFVPAPRPSLTLEEMREPDTIDAMVGVERILVDLSPELRAEMVTRIKAVYEALTAEADARGPAEPPSLIYALH